MSTKVYISSTYEDLIAERAKLQQALRMAGYDPLCMEVYPAFRQRPKEKCEEDVRASDIYVCIIGNRYGSKPSGHDLSFTEYEYQAAIAYQPQKAVFAFAKDAEIHDAELARFKRHLTDNHGVPTFRNELELCLLVLASIANHLQPKLQKLTTGKTFLDRNLIYLCDREPQYADLTAQRRVVRDKAIIFSLEGQVNNRHRSFIRRLNIKEDRHFLLTEINLKVEGCNSPRAVSQRILISIFNDIENKGMIVQGKLAYTSLAKFLGTQAFQTMLIVLYIHESFINDKMKMQKYKEGIAELSEDIKDVKIAGKSLLFCICLEEETSSTRASLPKIVSSNRQVKRLPRLPDISSGDVKDWLERHNIERIGSRIDDILRSIYVNGSSALPMSEIERELELIILGYNAKQNGN